MENGINTRKRIKISKTFVGLALSLLLIGAGFFGLHLYVTAYNGKPHSVDMKLTDWGRSDQIDNSVVYVAPRGGKTDTWVKTIDIADENGNLVDTDYRGTIYDLTVENHNANEIREWSVKFTVNELSYLNNAWCGKVEVHQKAGTDKEYVQTHDLRNFNSTNLKTRTDSDDLMIVLEPGDYFIYLPSSLDKELPLRGTDSGLSGKTTCGFIMYTEDLGTTPEYPFSSVVFNFDTSRRENEYSFYWILWVLVCCWVMLVVSNLISKIKLSSMVKEREKDMQIIKQTMETFTGFIDAKDPYTRGHSLRVAQYSAMLAQKLGFSEADVQNIYYIALLHDSGKIGIKEEVLCKPGKLTADEYEQMKMHTTKGYEILANYTAIPNVAIGAKYHHERYDGKGYPEGLAGEEIPLIARIICVADSFDAMNSDRVYRKRMNAAEIMSELVNNKGKQFDSKVVDVMIDLLNEGKIVCGE